MQEEKVEAVLLTSHPYLKGKRILKVFSKEAGLISLMASARHAPSLSSPLTSFEIVYSKKNSDLYTVIDIKILSYHFELRKSYEHLLAASELLRSLLASQLPGKPSPLLYELLQSYLHKIPRFSNPFVLAASFMLKLLAHDGLLSSSFENLPCSPEEYETLSFLTQSRSFSDLEAVSLSSSLLSRLSSFFEALVR